MLVCQLNLRAWLLLHGCALTQLTPTGPALARVFADAAAVKVLHGADRDIQWLQRDFGLYVVNMFDTGQAARVLGLAGHGLGFALQHYCDVKVVGARGWLRL